MAQTATAKDTPAHSSTESAPRVVGRPFAPGQSGNPAGRPKGLAKTARDLIGDDPSKLLNVFRDIALDDEAKPGDRVAAAREYLDRAYGKAPAYAPVDGTDPLDLADPLDHRIAAVLDDLAPRRETRAASESPAASVEATSQAGAAAA